MEENQNAYQFLNTGPLPDGSIDAQDFDTLRKVGGYIRKYGCPTSGEWNTDEVSKTLKHVKST